MARWRRSLRHAQGAEARGSRRRGTQAWEAQARAGESGSGSLLAVGVIASVFALTMMLVPLSQALTVKQRVTGAADAAALAAANTVSGAIAGFPCESADVAAQLNGAALRRCELDGSVATVSAGTRYLGFDIVVFARAGPPGSAQG